MNTKEANFRKHKIFKQNYNKNINLACVTVPPAGGFVNPNDVPIRDNIKNACLKYCVRGGTGTLTPAA
jgi:hypothetical protein